VKIGLRRGDNTLLSLVEIIPEAEASKAEPSTTEGKAKRQPTTRKRQPKKLSREPLRKSKKRPVIFCRVAGI